MSLAKIVDLIEKTDNKTELRIAVGSGGTLRMDLERQVKGKGSKPLAVPISSHVGISSIDDLAGEFILDLAAQQLGLKDRYSA